ncbi:hypothetical protein D8B22_09060 [Verminephrobacter aporrectodeae subsp. tuberculatae]|uniref:hypothetical protein n=1 Tax=Verminephrobacter aporrectodeae TaxID=1110389 RepID=UPI00023753DC|nr:hypothetical protein [Verminephrobacter aporrectodeae subsp. tuberculatae]MCW8169251.1 hypothetical protein [Verminephrobacter aporrectodeae subsp. tuberculatae]
MQQRHWQRFQSLFGLKQVFGLPLRALRGLAQSLRVVLPVLRMGEPRHLAVDDNTGPKRCVYGQALAGLLQQISPGAPMDTVGGDGACGTKACHAQIAACAAAMPWPQATPGAS